MNGTHFPVCLPCLAVTTTLACGHDNLILKELKLRKVQRIAQDGEGIQIQGFLLSVVFGVCVTPPHHTPSARVVRENCERLEEGERPEKRSMSVLPPPPSEPSPPFTVLEQLDPLSTEEN